MKRIRSRLTWWTEKLNERSHLMRPHANTHRLHFLSFSNSKENLYPVVLFDYKSSKRALYNDIVYVKHKVHKDVSYWRCLRWKKGCRARLSTCLIGGCTMTKKANDEIIHAGHWWPHIVWAQLIGTHNALKKKVKMDDGIRGIDGLFRKRTNQA